jgi:hypothetical protein
MKPNAEADPPNPQVKSQTFVPLDRNVDFVGRKEILNVLVEKFRSTRNNQMIATLYGLGGVGKSQIAMEYAYMF